MTIFNRIRLLPLLVIVASMSFVVRVGDVLTGFSALSGAAYAEQAAESVTDHDEHAKDMSDDTFSGHEENTQAASHEDTTHDDTPDKKFEGTPVEWADADETDFEYSEVKMELFKALTERRKKLEQREKELAHREALLKAAQQEFERKFDELSSIRAEIQNLLKKQSEEEEARIVSLVKIYEGMKPKDAARIFNTLDMDVLIEVMSRMSERKSSPVIAAMNPDRARTITILLSEQKKLPSLSGR